jgi:hypothetical protein
VQLRVWGVFHVEVYDEVNRSGYLKFLDNCDVLTVEEGFIEEEEIVESLQISCLTQVGIGC